MAKKKKQDKDKYFGGGAMYDPITDEIYTLRSKWNENEALKRKQQRQKRNKIIWLVLIIVALVAFAVLAVIL